MLPEARENFDVRQLAKGVGGKTGKGYAEDKGVERVQICNALKDRLKKKHGNEVGKDECREHGTENNLSRLGSSKNTDRKISGQVDKREAECAPGGMEAENLYRQLNQIVTCRNDEDMKGGQDKDGTLYLRLGEGEHVLPFWLSG